MARNATDESWGHLEHRRYALHDRDTKFCASFRATLASRGTKPIQLPARSPNLNACGEMGTLVKQECLSKLILFGERSLPRVLGEFVEHFHGAESPGQGQRAAVSPQRGKTWSASKIGLLQRAPGRTAQILQPCRMNILAFREAELNED